MSSDLPRLADDVTLTETLRLAVPCYMEQLVALPPSEREPRALGWQLDGAKAVGAAGDALQFGGGKRGRAALAFEALAKGLAAAAVLYGRAKFGDLSWSPPPVGCWAVEPVRVRLARRPVQVVELPECAA